MTPLGRRLFERIAATGPITVADYMAECLMHPEHGYYATRDPFGRAGDFVTAPEMSQMFGELLGLALAQAWVDRGEPRAVLAELGPGRGTLMADALRAVARVAGFREAVAVHLVEGSPVLRARQAAALAGQEVAWHQRIDSLPEAPLFLVANEFLDALPVRQFVREGASWRERAVGLRDGRLAFGLSPAAPRAELVSRLADTREGEVVETGAPAVAVVAQAAARVARHGGVALFLDYGGWRSRGDTLQAVREHAFADPLETPGEADLTAHVDWEPVANAAAAAGARVAGPVPQGVLLERLGITARAQALARGLTGPALEAHVAAHRRLTHPEGMGTLVQALAVFDRGPTPPGFAP